MADSQALAGLRIVELSGISGAYCGKLFADLGADVVLVEPVGGSPLRAKPPFFHDKPGPDNSLLFAYFAANKQNAVLNLSDPKGRMSLERLVVEADLLILADHPEAAFVDLDQLCARHPRLVGVRITPYGADGPYAGFAGDDLSLMAMGGLLTMAGYPDRAPVVAYGEQGLLAADQFAAVSALSALLHAEQTGDGEIIDVSIQEAIVMALENAAQTYQLEGKVRNRTGTSTRAGTGIYPCKDGELYLLAGGIGDTNMWSNFARWMEAEGVAGAATFGAPDWNDSAPGAEETFSGAFIPYAANKTKAELYAMGREWRVPMAPMSTPTDLLSNEQLAHRGYFVPCPAGSPMAGLRMPGAPYKLTKTPWAMRNAAPSLNAAIERQEREYNA
jgi:benzylsuccinate CoA-transferase BbsE subunit